MNRFLALFVDKLMRHGDLEVETCDGAKRRFGDGAGPKIAIRFADRAAEREFLLNPELALGELYMDGRLELVEGDLYEFVALAAEQLDCVQPVALDEAARKGARPAQSIQAAQQSQARQD